MRHEIMKSVVLVIALTLATGIYGQVTIGSLEAPSSGALLDLKEGSDGRSRKGLGLPRVELHSLDQLRLGTSDYSGEELVYTGLVVFNAKKTETQVLRICPGIHVWNGTNWEALGDYPEIKERKVTISLDRSFEYLNPSNPAGWPADKEIDRLNGKYDLGRKQAANNTQDLVDNRQNDISRTYTVSRFYVGYKVLEKTYQVQRSYLCDPNAAPNWINEEIVNEIEKTFVDGVWMTQNLAASRMPDGMEITKTLSNNDANPYCWAPNSMDGYIEHYGALYNWAAAINMGTGVGQTPNPEPGSQGGSGNDDVRIQGVCPARWHLPSDQEWTDLENGIARYYNDFTTGISEPPVAITYNDIDWRGKTTGEAIKSAAKPLVSSLETNGSSKTGIDGGFDAYLAGNVYNGSPENYGISASFWTASYYQSNLPAFRSLNNNSADIFRSGSARANYYSVRCKKD